MSRFTNARRAGSFLAVLALSAILMITLPPQATAENAKKEGFLERMGEWQDKMSEKFRDT
jgi:hypothetical protein